MLPIIPTAGVSVASIFLALSTGVKEFDASRLFVNLIQVNRGVKKYFRNTTNEREVRITNGTAVRIDINSNVQLGEVMDVLNVRLAFPPLSLVANLTNPKYAVFTSFWDFKGSFADSSSFIAKVDSDDRLTCTDLRYEISGRKVFGLLCPLMNATSGVIADVKSSSIVLTRITFPSVNGNELPRSALTIVDALGEA